MSARMPQKPFSGDLDKHPVLTVSWDDIMNPDGFCEWASDVAGFKLTLPTEARCEDAARGGKDALLYPWGNDFDRSKLWCSDYWYEDYPAVGKDPVDRRKSKARCVRGGSWDNYYPGNLRCAFRFRSNPDVGYISLGFRLSAGPK